MLHGHYECEADRSNESQPNTPRGFGLGCDKALEKDRSRRYESASGFAADNSKLPPMNRLLPGRLQCFIQVRKFVKKNKLGVAAALTIFMSLAVGMAGTFWDYIERK